MFGVALFLGEVLARLGRILFGLVVDGAVVFACMEPSLAYWRSLRSTSILFSARMADVAVVVGLEELDLPRLRPC